jgi:hypothetical protein
MYLGSVAKEILQCLPIIFKAFNPSSFFLQAIKVEAASPVIRKLSPKLVSNKHGQRK